MKNLKTFSSLILLLLAFSCNDDQGVRPSTSDNPGYTITPLSDGKIKNEILSMVEGAQKPGGNKNGMIVPPQTFLPAGYNYNNALQVKISGTNWTSYVAWKTTGNTSTFKEAITLYYDGSGNFKNFLKTTWQKHTPVKHTYMYYMPEQNFANYSRFLLVDNGGSGFANQGASIRPPSECGQQVADCITSFYSQQGWFSVGLTIATFVAPEIGFGVIGGCMLGCALGY